MKRSSFVIWILVALAATLLAQQDEFAKFTGPYLGQEPPGTTPEVFARGVVSMKNSDEFFCLFWDKGKHLIFLRDGSGYLESIYKENHWTELKNMGISAMEPCSSPSGNKLFYNVFNKDDKTGNYIAEIWTLGRRGNAWSKPEYSGINGMGPAVDLEGNLYFSTNKDGLTAPG
jgi:hypothetical protein